MTILVFHDAEGNALGFENAEAAVQHVNMHGQETFTVFGLEEMYRHICRLTIDVDDERDYEDLKVLRAWKSQASSWGDVADLNETRDDIRERIAQRRRRLKYGGRIPAVE